MSQSDSIQFGSTLINYSIRRTARRDSIAITVHADSSVSVAAPKGTRRTLIADKVIKKAKWIVRQQERHRQNGKRPAHKFVSGESFRYLGRQYPLKKSRQSAASAKPQMALRSGCLRVTVPRRWGAERRRGEVRAVLTKWYRERARIQIGAIVERYQARLDVTVSSCLVREMKTRWGSGGPNGRLRFNWRIIMAPRRLVEYVAAHELCHIRHQDHSRDFWRLLGRVMPDYEQRRQELERLGPVLDVF